MLALFHTETQGEVAVSRTRDHFFTVAKAWDFEEKFDRQTYREVADKRLLLAQAFGAAQTARMQLEVTQAAWEAALETVNAVAGEINDAVEEVADHIQDSGGSWRCDVTGKELTDHLIQAIDRVRLRMSFRWASISARHC